MISKRHSFFYCRLIAFRRSWPLSSYHTNIEGSYIDIAAINCARRVSDCCNATWCIHCLMHPINLNVLHIVDELTVTPNIVQTIGICLGELGWAAVGQLAQSPLAVSLVRLCEALAQYPQFDKIGSNTSLLCAQICLVAAARDLLWARYILSSENPRCKEQAWSIRCWQLQICRTLLQHAPNFEAWWSVLRMHMIWKSYLWTTNPNIPVPKIWVMLWRMLTITRAMNTRPLFPPPELIREKAAWGQG